MINSWLIALMCFAFFCRSVTAQQDLLLNVIPSSNNSGKTSDEDTWTSLNAGESIYGIRYDQNGAVVFNNNLLMGCVIDPQFPDETKVYVSMPSPLKSYVMIMCWDRGGKEAYIIDTKKNRIASRDVVPKHWRVIKWVSWSPDERYALVTAAGEVTNGDMTFVDLLTGKVDEIHFKNFTRNPQQQDEIQYFEPEGVSWTNSKMFNLRLDVHCNPYDGDENCLKNILRSYPAQVSLSPFRITYKKANSLRNTKNKQRATSGNSQTGKGIRSVDLRNFTYEVRDSGDVEYITLKNGKNLVKSDYTDIEYGYELSPVKYADFDGDGNEEAFVVLHYTQEAAGVFYVAHYYVFAYKNGETIKHPCRNRLNYSAIWVK